jgi:hypothetical protein
MPFPTAKHPMRTALIAGPRIVYSIVGIATIWGDAKAVGQEQPPQVSRWKFKVNRDRIVYEKIRLDPQGKRDRRQGAREQPRLFILAIT